MKNLFTCIILGLCLQSIAQPPEGFLTVGVIDSVYSSILKENRKIWVYTPNGNGVGNKERYPVLYLLDGNAHFYSVAGMIQQLSEVNNNTICPDMVIVGILNTDRTRDLTPTSITRSFYMSGDAVKTSGGSENFTAFIEKELMSYIESHYPVTTYRTIVGHSLGGLFVVNTLLNHPNLFNAYVAIDPSLWWDNQKVLKQAGTALQQNTFTNKSLFFAVANTMTPGMDTARVINDTSGGNQHIRANLLFARCLEFKSNNGLRYSWKYYSNDNHGSVPLIAEYDALRFIFDYYKLPEGNPDFLSAEMLKKHYRLISDRLGYVVPPSEALINNMGYVWLQRNDMEKAFTYFKLNIENYPNSSNAYDSMGDFYIAQKDNKKAIEYLTKALTLKDVPETKRKLEKLKSANN